MTPSYEGPERRKACGDFEREIIGFMARIDQRNIDKDIANAAREQIAEDHEERIQALEHAVTVAKTIGVGVPTIGGLIAAAFKLGGHFKG